MNEIRSLQSCGPTISLGDVLEAAVGIFAAEVRGEEPTADRSARLTNLEKLAAFLALWKELDAA